jgi:hypothetical protein
MRLVRRLSDNLRPTIGNVETVRERGMSWPDHGFRLKYLVLAYVTATASRPRN